MKHQVAMQHLVFLSTILLMDDIHSTNERVVEHSHNYRRQNDKTS